MQPLDKTKQTKESDDPSCAQVALLSLPTEGWKQWQDFSAWGGLTCKVASDKNAQSRCCLSEAQKEKNNSKLAEAASSTGLGQFC